MENFKSILAQLPSVENIQQIELYSGAPSPTAIIENLPGQSGSLAVYNKLLTEFGEITPQAAQTGLQLFAEHTLDAKQNPGKHPNIDRLFNIIAQNSKLSANIVKK